MDCQPGCVRQQRLDCERELKESLEDGRRAHDVDELGVVAAVVALDLLHCPRPGLVRASAVAPAPCQDQLREKLVERRRHVLGLLEETRARRGDGEREEGTGRELGHGIGLGKGPPGAADAAAETSSNNGKPNFFREF